MEFFLLFLKVTMFSFDVFTIAFTSGLCIEYLRMNNIVKISLLFSFFQVLMVLIGWKLGLIVIDLIYHLGGWISFCLLSIIGIKMIDDALNRENNEIIKRINPLEKYTFISLAFYSSLDELALGFNFNLTEKNPIYILATFLGLVTFLLSFLGLVISHKISHNLGRIINDQVKLVGGIFLLVISIQIFWQHLFEQITK